MDNNIWVLDDEVEVLVDLDTLTGGPNPVLAGPDQAMLDLSPFGQGVIAGSALGLGSWVQSDCSTSPLPDLGSDVGAVHAR